MAGDPGIVDVIKPLARVILEFTDGSVIEVKSGNIQREELFRVHTNYGLLAVNLAITTVGWQPLKPTEVLAHPLAVNPNTIDKRQVEVHDTPDKAV